MSCQPFLPSQVCVEIGRHIYDPIGAHIGAGVGGFIFTQVATRGASIYGDSHAASFCGWV
jgi:hypothetical protein